MNIAEFVWGLWHWMLKTQVMEQSPHPVYTSYRPMCWSRAHLKINASNRNQHLTCLFDISYEGRPYKESLNSAPEGFGRPTWISYLIGRGATGPSHTQLPVTPNDFTAAVAAAQGSQGRADLPGKVHRHMADTTTTPPTGWGRAGIPPGLPWETELPAKSI